MLLQRLTPPVPLDGFRQEMERLFDEFTTPWAGRWIRDRAFPAINVWEDGECVYAEAEVPGLSMGELEVTVVGSELCLKGCRKASENSNWKFHRRERGTGEFSRFITLPLEVDADRVEAVLKNGVLTITLPKAAAARPRKISVKVNG